MGLLKMDKIKRIRGYLERIYWPATLRGRLIVMALMMVTLPTLCCGYLIDDEGHQELIKQKQRKLFSITQMLDDALGDQLARFSDMPRQQRIIALNHLLAPTADHITKAFQGVGAGYYSRALDAIIVYAPQSEFSDMTGKTIAADHPGREVMATATRKVGWGTQVRGDIMNAMTPIKRHGRVVGYIWANELMMTIRHQALWLDIKVLAVIIVGIGVSLLLILLFSKYFIRDIQLIKQTLHELSQDLNRDPVLMHGELGEINHSISELARALREVRTLNDLIIENAADGVISVDNQGIVTMINPAAEKIIGYQRQELLGIPYEDIFSNTDFNSPILDTLKNGNNHVAQDVTFPARYHTVELSVSTSRISNSQGEMIGALVIFCDQTERKNVQRRLEQAERLATLGELMAGVAHEVRNPLTAISGFVQILKDGETNPQRLNYVKIILKEVNSINKVIQQLLDFARPCPGIYQQVSINHLLRECFVLVKTKGLEARIDFHVALDESLPNIEADGELLKQVFLNIMLNATQSIAARGRISITTQPAAQPAAQCVVIEDDGCGIPKTAINRIFDPFFTTKPTGTGLGLAISQRIIAVHQGDIECHSMPGHGTRFTITLPATQEGKANDERKLSYLNC